MVETTSELPRGIRTNNPGNIDYNQNIFWAGQVHPQPANDRFCHFTSAEYGIRAIFKLLNSYYHKDNCRTVEQFISRWAPINENDTTAYVWDVLIWAKAPWMATTVLYPRDFPELCEAIIHHENGQMPYTPAQIACAERMANFTFS
jgi:hypothetical protein